MKNINIYEHLKNFVIKHVSNDSAGAYFLKFIYRLLIVEYIDAIITIIGTVLIGIMIGINYFGVFFWVVVVIYMVLIFAVACAKRFLKEKNREHRIFKQALIGVDSTLRTWAIELQKCAKSLYNNKSRTANAIQRSVSSIDFQTAAFIVCEKIWQNLTKYCENENIYVTVFQKQENEDGCICKMIAYSGDHEPSSYGQSYIIPEYSENLLGKIEYHTYLFAVNRNDIAVLPDHKSVLKNFLPHEQSVERENSVQ